MNFTMKGHILVQRLSAFLFCVLCQSGLASKNLSSHYSSEIDRLPTFLACNSEQVIDFQSVRNTAYSAEVYVMASRQKHIGAEWVGHSWMRHKRG